MTGSMARNWRCHSGGDACRRTGFLGAIMGTVSSLQWLRPPPERSGRVKEHPAPQQRGGGSEQRAEQTEPELPCKRHDASWRRAGPLGRSAVAVGRAYRATDVPTTKKCLATGRFLSCRRPVHERHAEGVRRGRGPGREQDGIRRSGQGRAAGGAGGGGRTDESPLAESTPAAGTRDQSPQGQRTPPVGPN